MKEEYEMLCEMLAKIRASMTEEDFIDNEGHDRLGACVGSPVEVLAVMEMKMERLMQKVQQLEANHEEKGAFE